MHIKLTTLIILLTTITSVICDVSISKPLIGRTFSGSGGSIEVDISWTESNAEPTLDEIISYTFTICTGPNNAIHALRTLAENIESSQIQNYNYKLHIPNSIGSNGIYYIQIYSKTSNGFTIHYTNRFELIGMVGSYKPTIGLINTPPEAQTSLANEGGFSKSFALPYSLQTGATKYAPMQTQPSTKVTKNKNSWTRQYPTSSVSYYNTIKTGALSQVSTITPGWSYTISSAVNYASPNGFPSQNGGWYNPASKLTLKPSLVRDTETGGHKHRK